MPYAICYKCFAKSVPFCYDERRMIKLLFMIDIRTGKEAEYFEFAVQEFVPKIQRLGLQPTEAWYSVYGSGPQILAGLVAEDRAALEKALSSDEWQRVTKKLMTYVSNFQYKIVKPAGHFQL